MEGEEGDGEGEAAAKETLAGSATLAWPHAGWQKQGAGWGLLGKDLHLIWCSGCWVSMCCMWGGEGGGWWRGLENTQVEAP